MSLSDLLTVLTEAAISLLALPLLVLIVIVITQALMLVLSTLVLVGMPHL